MKLVQLDSLSLWEPHLCIERSCPLSTPPEGKCLLPLSTIPLGVLTGTHSCCIPRGLLASVPKPPCCLEWWHVVFHALWHMHTGFTFCRFAILVLTRTYGCSLGPSNNSTVFTQAPTEGMKTAYLPKCGPEEQDQLSARAWDCTSSLPKVSTSCGSSQQLPHNCLQSEVGLLGSDLVDMAVLDRRLYQGHYSFLWWSPNPTEIIREWAFYFSGLCLNQDVKIAYFLHNFCHLVEGGGSECSQWKGPTLPQGSSVSP